MRLEEALKTGKARLTIGFQVYIVSTIKDTGKFFGTYSDMIYLLGKPKDRELMTVSSASLDMIEQAFKDVSNDYEKGSEQWISSV